MTLNPELPQFITGAPKVFRGKVIIGNGAPWNRKIRSPGGGDNLFLCSIVALDADTEEYRWHYQTVPGESWDYNSSMDIVLADLEIGGRTVKVLWKQNLGLGISAPPVTFSVNGRQYVSILVGWGAAGAALGGSLTAQHGWAYKAQPRRLVTFALGSQVELPASPPPRFDQPLTAPGFHIDEALALRGAAIYAGKCALCHGPTANPHF